MSMKIGGTDEYNSEINVTPMVDVMLVLLIIFMIVTPLLQQGVTVNVPKDMISPDPDEEIAKDTSVVIVITKDGNFNIGKQAFPIDALGDVIKKRMEGKTPEKRVVYIRGDVDTNYGDIVKAVDVVRRQDIDKIGLVADKKKGDPAQK